MLTAKEREQRQIALGPTVPEKNEAMCQCSTVINFSVFFDGTGNNRSDDTEKKKLSNIAKLFDAHKNDIVGSVAKRYIPGVGTPYPVGARLNLTTGAR